MRVREIKIFSQLPMGGRTNDVSFLQMKTVQVVQSSLSLTKKRWEAHQVNKLKRTGLITNLHNILEYHKRRPLRLSLITKSYLSYTPIFAKEIIEIFASDGVV